MLVAVAHPVAISPLLLVYTPRNKYSVLGWLRILVQLIRTAYVELDILGSEWDESALCVAFTVR